jgi:hypothetical protein
MKEAFDDQLERHQVAWRNAHVRTSAFGTHARRRRAWILPEEAWEEGLWPGIRSDGDNPVSTYLSKHGVKKHTGANNLKSSWVLCANLYFTFGGSEEGRAMLAGLLREHVAREIQSLDAVELEFAELQALHPSVLLGEAGGARGSGQTSPDVAFVVNNGKGLILTESKLAEHSFYTCSARTLTGTETRPANPDPKRCDNALAVLDDPRSNCHQVVWGRKYWEHLRPVANRTAWSTLSCCPAARAGYQLFRQQALAEGIASTGKYNLVVSCVALDRRNDILANSLTDTGVSQIRDWSRLFDGRARFVVFSHQEWVAWVCAHDHGAWTEWRSWIEARYGLA